jgi:ADP-heptose:LPS heptosyltransferase
VLRALGLGDLLTAVPALRALAAAFPRHDRVLAAPAALAPLVELLAAGVTVRDAAPLAPLRRETPPPDVAVNLHGRGPQSHRILAATRPARLVAFAHPDVPGHRGPPWRAGEHEVRRWCRLLTESGIPADPARLDLRAPSVPVPAAAHGATLLHPGAGSAARRWPARRWAAVARAEAARGRAVLLTGTAGERAPALEIAAAAGLGEDAVLAGRTGLPELAGLVAAAGRVVCGDTGVAHLATAMGRPSVVLFGPTPPAEWGPPPGRARHGVLWAGRRGDPHADRADPGLLAITADRVLAELDRVERVAG